MTPADTISLLTVHRDGARDAFFSEGAERPLFFDPKLDSWVATNPRDCEAILRAPQFRETTYEVLYEKMRQRNPAFSFPNMLFAFKYLPLCLNGDEHRVARRRAAEFLAARRSRMVAALPAMVDRWLSRLEATGEVELMGIVVRPLVEDFVAELTGIESSARPERFSVSAVFDRMIGAKARRLIDDGLGEIRAAIRRSAGSDLSEDEEGVRLLLVIVGTDALLGTLGDSLHTLLRGNPGRRLDQIEYPPMPVATGVPIVERIADEALECAGVRFAKGQRVRVLLQAFQYSALPADRAHLFGGGAHVCLGRQLSVDLWSCFIARLSKIRRRMTVSSFDYRTDDYVLTLPSNFTVILSE